MNNQKLIGAKLFALLLCLSSAAFANPWSKHSNLPKVEDQFRRLGGDPKSLYQAVYFLHQFGGREFFYHRDWTVRLRKLPSVFVIQDLNITTDELRLFAINLRLGTVDAFFSTHGTGKGLMKNTYKKASFFSNQPQSNLTPTGFHLIGEKMSFRENSWAFRLYGIEEEKNHHSLIRGILLHPSSYVKEEYGVTGNTLGCVGVSWSAWNDIEASLLPADSGSTFLYNYGPYEKRQAPTYVGENLMLKNLNQSQIKDDNYGY